MVNPGPGAGAVARSRARGRGLRLGSASWLLEVLGRLVEGLPEEGTFVRERFSQPHNPEPAECIGQPRW